VWNSISFQNINNSHSFSVTLVSDVGDSVYLLFIDKIGGFFDHLRLIHLIWNFRDNDALSPLHFFKMSFGAQHYPTSSGMESLSHSFISVDRSSGGEIRSLNVLH